MRALSIQWTCQPISIPVWAVDQIRICSNRSWRMFVVYCSIYADKTRLSQYSPSRDSPSDAIIFNNSMPCSIHSSGLSSLYYFVKCLLLTLNIASKIDILHWFPKIPITKKAFGFRSVYRCKIRIKPMDSSVLQVCIQLDFSITTIMRISSYIGNHNVIT